MFFMFSHHVCRNVYTYKVLVEITTRPQFSMWCGWIFSLLGDGCLCFIILCGTYFQCRRDRVNFPYTWNMAPIGLFLCSTYGSKLSYLQNSIQPYIKLLFINVSASRQKSSWGPTSGAGRQYVKARPIRGSTICLCMCRDSSLRLDSCCRSSWSIWPPLWACQLCQILDKPPWCSPSLSHDSHYKHDLWSSDAVHFFMM